MRRTTSVETVETITKEVGPERETKLPLGTACGMTLRTCTWCTLGYRVGPRVGGCRSNVMMLVDAISGIESRGNTLEVTAVVKFQYRMNYLSRHH